MLRKIPYYFGQGPKRAILVVAKFSIKGSLITENAFSGHYTQSKLTTKPSDRLPVTAMTPVAGFDAQHETFAVNHITV